MAQEFSASGSGRSYGSISSYNESLPNVTIAGQGQSSSHVLCESITTNIYTINSSWKQLEQALKVIGTNKDNQGVRDKVHVTQLSTNEIIAQTTQDLQNVTALVRKTPSDKQQKLQIDRLMNLFKEAVQAYSSIQKQVANKMKICLLPSEVAIQSETQEQLIDIEDTRLQRQNVKDMEFEQSMMQEQEVRVKKIESEIIDVNQIMRELGALVHQQSEPISLIENEIENVQNSVESAEQQLVKAEQYQNKRRRKTACLLLVASVALSIVGLLLYISLK